MKRSRLFMLNVIDANPVGRYRVEDASPTDGVGAGTAGKVAGTTTGAVVPAGVVAPAGAVVPVGVVAPAGVVAGTPGMDAHAVGRCRVEDARLIDSDGEAGRKLTC